MKLILEETFDLDSVVELNESTGEKTYVIKGTFSTPEIKNRNGRIYGRKLWEDNVANYQKELKAKSINTLMEKEHPQRTEVDPSKAIARIRKLEMREGNVYGEATIFNRPDTQDLRNRIELGKRIGVSSRGVGKLNGDIVEAFTLITYDIVKSPSDFNANTRGFNESLILEHVEIESDGHGGWICTPEGCTLKENTSVGDIAMTMGDKAPKSEKHPKDCECEDCKKMEEGKMEDDKALEIYLKDLARIRIELGKVLQKTSNKTAKYVDKTLGDTLELLQGEVDMSNTYTEGESKCACKVKELTEALEKFSTKGIKTEDDILKERFKELFGTETIFETTPTWNTKSGKWTNASKDFIASKKDIEKELKKIETSEQADKWLDDNNATFDIIVESQLPYYVIKFLIAKGGKYDAESKEGFGWVFPDKKSHDAAYEYIRTHRIFKTIDWEKHIIYLASDMDVESEGAVNDLVKSKKAYTKNGKGKI